MAMVNSPSREETLFREHVRNAVVLFCTNCGEDVIQKRVEEWTVKLHDNGYTNRDALTKLHRADWMAMGLPLISYSSITTVPTSAEVLDRISVIGGCLDSLIGHTPLLQINFKYDGKHGVIYAKNEQVNFTGSIKDRMAIHILRKSYEAGLLKPGDTIVEASSGNTGIAFAALGRALGHPVRIYMPDWMSQERKQLIASYGAEIIHVSKEQGGFLGSIEMAEKFAKDNANVFLPRQFSNELNIEAHRLYTGHEIAEQLSMMWKRPDAFIAGVGTGGTVTGVSRAFAEIFKDQHKVAVHPLEPANSPTLRTGHKVGSHRIQGISDEFIPECCNLKELDEVIDVFDGDAILMAQRLSSQLGLAVGISSGANFIGALKILTRMRLQRGDDAPMPTVVTVFPDCSKKYLSTGLMQQEPIKDEYLAPDVMLESFTVAGHVGLQN